MDKDDIRFWGKVDIKCRDDCWEWQASTSGGRYGKFKVNGKLVSSHRYAYQYAYGDLRDNMLVLHHCDNKRCVNPNHLYQGTQFDNIRDRDLRNPIPPEVFGFGKAKLYAGEIWLVRRLKGIVSSTYASKMFNVSNWLILDIWRKDKHLCREGYYA